MTKVKVFNVLPESEQEQELSAYLSEITAERRNAGALDDGYTLYTSATNSGFGTTHKVSHFITVISREVPSKKLEEVKETQ